MDNLRPALAPTCREVFSDLPIHRGLQCVLHGQRPALDEKVAVQRRHARHARECLHKRRILHRIDVRVGHFDLGGGEQVGFDFRPVKVGVVEADRLGGVKAVQVNQFAARGGVHESRAAAAGEVEDQFEAIH